MKREWFESPLATITLLILICFASYWPLLQADFIWDDVNTIFVSPTACSLDGLKKIWFQLNATPQYYPMTYTSLWLDCQINGVDPVWYHASNILYQAFAAFVLLAVLKELGIAGALVAAMIFAIHPVQVESVGWIHERKNILGFLFALSSIFFFLKYLRKDKFSVRSYWISISLYLFALLSKTVTCSVPAVLIVLIWWRESKIQKKHLTPLIPFLLAGFAAAGVTVYLERVHVGAAGEEFFLTFAERFLVAGRALWFYVSKIIWPTRLVFIYPRWELDPWGWGWIFPLSWLALLIGLWQLKQKGAIAGVIIFSLVLFPALGFINVYPMIYSFVADHFQYMACSAIIILLVNFGLVVFKKYKWVQGPLAAAILMALMATTFARTQKYQTLKILWEDTIHQNPSSWMAYNNLGAIYAKEGQLDVAEELVDRSLTLNPKNVSAMMNRARMFLLRNKWAEAEALANEGIKRRPDLVLLHRIRGEALRAQNRLDESKEAFTEADRLSQSGI